MFHHIFKAIFISFGVYFAVFLLSRMLGRKLVSQMTFFDYIVGIMIGSAAVNSVTFEDNPPLFAFVTLVVVCLLTLLIDIIHMKSMKIRKIVDSEPVVIIEKGIIIDKNMKKTRLTLDELTMMLRENSYFSISDVECAVLEPNGQLSVLAKAEKQPLTPSDVNLSPGNQRLGRDIIMDGKVLGQNLTYIGKDEHWLKKQLLNYGVHNYNEVFYAGFDTIGNLYVSKRQNFKETPGMHGIE